MDNKTRELIAIGAAIAANCEASFKQHYEQARKLGVSQEDIGHAVTMALKATAPAQAMLALVNRYLGGTASAEEAGAPSAGTRRGTPGAAQGRRSAMPKDSTRRAGKTGPGGWAHCCPYR